MSLLILSVLGAIAATVEEVIERYHERIRWQGRRARQYTFN